MIVRKLVLVFCLFCSVLLSAQITVPSNSITLGEYFWDTDPGEGNGTPLVAFDGNWDESMESVSESISSLLFNGYHTFNIRVKDADGVWSSIFSNVIYFDQLQSLSASDFDLTQGEYFWDTDPGEGNGTPLVAFDGNWDESMESVSESISSLLFNGYHTFNIRVKDADGVWSSIFSNVIYFNDPSIIYGCTDSAALNYVPLATLDDGSCSYPCLPDTSFTYINVNDSLVWNGITYDSSGTYTYNGSSTINNSSASLDGINDYINIGNNSVLNIDNSVTIEAWINAANLSNRNAIYSTRKNNDPGSFQLEIGSESNVGTSFVAVTGPGTWIAITASNVINNNSGWVHIAYTRDGVGDNHEIYINGIPQAINTNPYTFANNNALKEIGRGTSQLQNYEGKIDQVSIWNIALSQQEIQNYMNCSPQGNEVGLVGYWNFEEGSGNTAYDQTANGNDGTINGATYDTNVPSQSCNLTNVNGCDSTAVLNLTINQADTYYTNLPDSISACDSVQICVDSIAGGSYSWSISNTSNSGNLAIGDIYQGGIVFWLDGNGGGLIAAPSDQSAETDWGCTGSDISGADGTAIGTGNQNTIDIEVGCSTTGTAPDICANLTLGGFSDWFLPSKDELNQMYLNIGQGSSLSNIGNFDNVPYWSSSEYNLHFAWVQSFLNGTPTYINKVVWTYNVRAIRAFSAPIIADTTNCIWVSNAGWNYITVTTANGITATDSVYVSLNTSVSGSSSVSACNTYTWEGQTITSSGNLTHTYQSTLGCDSLHTLSVTINNSTTNTTTITDCDSYTWSVNGTTYTQSGTYTDVSTNSSGCTHTEILVLTINNSTTNTTTITDCDSYTWSVNGTTYTQSGTYTDVSTNSSGCTHTEILVLTINNSTTNTTTITDCDSYTWSVNGTTYTQSGTYTDVSTNSSGCTHTEILVLTINNSTTNTTTITDCDSYTWSVNGTTYTQSGTYTDVSTNSSGCTHTEILVLTINNSTTNTTTITDCDSYTWSVNGTTYTQSGTYTDVSTNSSGCTHTEILVLTINNSTTNTTTITDCDSYTWSVNGTTYTQSGTYTDVSTNSSGCTHTEILVLTINNSTTNTTTITDCDSYTWSVNGTTYTQSGTYTDVSTNSSGCTHTEILVLTINNSTTNTTTITDCDSYTWSVNGTTYTQSGTYTDVSTNSSGCTHTETLVLIINNSTSLTNTVSICFGDSITLGSNTYSQTGIYTDVFTAVNGCDSIITTNLNVSQQITAIISQLGMDINVNPTGGNMPYVYEWYTGETSQIITPNQDGDYWVIVTDANGCLSDTSFFVVDWVHTSVEDFNIDRLSIYPNPSRDIFNIEFTSLLRQNLEIRIINSIGDIVYLENLDNYTGDYNKDINLKEFSKALYFLEIITDNGVVNKKLILQ